MMTPRRTSAAIVGVAAMSSTLLICPQAHAVTTLEPGHTNTRSTLDTLGSGLAHAEYTPLDLPTAGRVNFGITLRITETTHLIAQASIDQNGTLAVSAIGPHGQILGATDTPFTVQAGQRIIVESETIGDHRGTFRVRAWPQTTGVHRPGWQLDLTGAPLGAPEGQTSTYQSLSVSATQRVHVRNETRWVQPAGQLLGGPTPGTVTDSTTATFFATGGYCSVNGSPYRRCGSNGNDVHLNNLTPGMQIIKIRTRAEEPSSTHLWHVRPRHYGFHLPTLESTGVPAGRGQLPVVTGTSFGALDGDDDPNTITITEKNQAQLSLDNREIHATVIIRTRGYQINGAHLKGAPQPASNPPTELLRTVGENADVHLTDSHIGADQELTTTWSPWRGTGITLERVIVAAGVSTQLLTQPGVTIKGSYLKQVRHHSLWPPRFDQDRFVGNLLVASAQPQHAVSALVAPLASANHIVKLQQNWLPKPWVTQPFQRPVLPTQRSTAPVIPQQRTATPTQTSPHRVGVLTNVDLHHIMMARSGDGRNQTSCLSVDGQGAIASRWHAQCCAA